MSVGLLVPGRRCDLCGSLLLLAAVATPLGGMFCASHRDLPNCQLCSAPFRGGGRFCEPCAATSVSAQEQVRQVLPPVRDVLHALGVQLDPPVHIQLVDDARMHTLNTHESGLVAGVTVIRGQRVTEVYVLAGLPEIEFGATVAHECMHAWLAQNGFPKVDPSIEEGLCQVVAYRFLRAQKDPRASLLRLTIERAPDPVYGDGFRAARDSVRRHGMNPVLTAVKATGRLP